MMAPAPHEVDVLLTDGRVDTLLGAVTSHAVVCAACPCPDGKLSAPPAALLWTAAHEADWLIVEADGARRHPVKAPAPHEPQILEPSDVVVAVAGLTALGRPLREVCHRLELCCALLDTAPDALLTPQLLARLLTSGQGQFKNVGNAGRFRVLLNQADDEALAALGKETAAHILRLLPGCRVAVGALRQEQCVKEVYHAYPDQGRG
jgi:probable selenium-dependent hydroxylase accessory protein YqeC